MIERLQRACTLKHPAIDNDRFASSPKFKAGARDCSRRAVENDLDWFHFHFLLFT
jgi:hypothetical protein